MSNQLHRYRIVLDYIEPWLDEQDEATLKQIYADLLVLEKEGPSLGRPLVDRVKGKMERLVCDQHSKGRANIPSPRKEARSRWNCMSIWNLAG